MKKTFVGFLAVALVFVSSSLVFSQMQKSDTKGGGMMKDNMMGKGMMTDEGMDAGMMKMRTMHKMMSKEIVATSDGGVVVMSGNKLLKYDKNLNLKKEVELKTDMEGMQKMMKKMTKKCSCRKMMGKNDESAEE